MLNQSTLLDNLVTMLRSIPTLVTELGGSAYIKPIHDGNTDYSSVTEAIASIAPPGMIIWWESTSPAFVGNRMTWAHQFRAAIMPGTATPGGASRIFAAMLNGTPSAGAGQPMSLTRVNSFVHEMEPPSFHRAFLVIDPVGGSGLEYFEARISIKER